jgi:heparan sulfate 6-O-sulfotransferase HS6ST1
MLAVYDSNFTACDYLARKKLNESVDDEKLLERAKRGLRSLTYFALSEYKEQSRALFLATFNRKLFLSNKIGGATQIAAKFYRTEILLKSLNNTSTLAKIRDLNRLDIKLYEFAVELFFQRLKHFNL